MAFKRIIARLDIKNTNVIKGMQMDGLRVIGPIQELARKYYAQKADEIVLIDIVASLYGREAMAEIIRDFTSECFVPVTVGGGIRSLSDADLLFRAGADKVALNTAAIANPHLITEIATKYGVQAIVIHIDVKRHVSGFWEAYTESGRTPTGLDAVEWVSQSIERGAGEILLTSVDYDGTRRGLDYGLLQEVGGESSVPVVASGGTKNASDACQALQLGVIEGVALGAALHYDSTTIGEIRKECLAQGVNVREVDL